MEAVRKLAPPEDQKHLRAFLGLAEFYNRLIIEEAWQKLEMAVRGYPIIRLPCSEGKYCIYTDWSAKFVGAILHQVQKDGEFPTAYAPWKNGRAENMVRFVKSLLRRLTVEEPEL